MIVYDLDFVRPGIRPAEHDPPLIVDSDRVFAGQISLQSLKPIARRKRHVAQRTGIIQVHQLAARDLRQRKRKAFGHFALAQDGFGERLAKPYPDRRFAPSGHRLRAVPTRFLQSVRTAVGFAALSARYEPFRNERPA